ncbi:hypothetical protein HGA91_02690 [candidate division WWE3 bacterium]|nr:hypothetical protein [candidate division WWE3 bacterium]
MTTHSFDGMSLRMPALRPVDPGDLIAGMVIFRVERAMAIGAQKPDFDTIPHRLEPRFAVRQGTVRLKPLGDGHRSVEHSTLRQLVDNGEGASLLYGVPVHMPHIADLCLLNGLVGKSASLFAEMVQMSFRSDDISRHQLMLMRDAAFRDLPQVYGVFEHWLYRPQSYAILDTGSTLTFIAPQRMLLQSRFTQWHLVEVEVGTLCLQSTEADGECDFVVVSDNLPLIIRRSVKGGWVRSSLSTIRSLM